MNDDALYLEADEDITSAIDKLKKSSATGVQIVVPKRSPLLQSIINLKLLKKAAEANKKQLILVTSDKIATDLAARVGLAVAPTLGAKAVLSRATAAPAVSPDDDIIDESQDSDEVDSSDTKRESAPMPSRPKKPLLKRREVPDVPAPIDADLDASAASPAGALTATELESGPTSVSPQISPKRPPKVPNYRNLQRRALWIALAAVLIGGYVGGMYVFERADVTIYANGKKSDIDTNFTVKPGGTTDKSAGILAGEVVSASKDLTSSVTPSGKKDVGSKASGTMTIVNGDPTTDHDFVAGTRFQAPDGKIFRLDEPVHVDPATPKLVGFQFVTQPSQVEARVTADQNGDSYNEAPAKYTIPGLAASQQAYTYGQGAQMSGGVSKIATIVTQADVDSAVAAALEKDKDASGRDLTSKAGSGSFILTPSASSKTSEINPTPAVEAEATSASVAFKVTYSALAVKKSDYEAVIEAQEVKQVGADSQIYDNGLATAQLTASQPDKEGNIVFLFTTQAFSGTKIDTAALSKSIAGKRYGDGVDVLRRQPGVADVDVELKPSWSFNMPARSSNINITIKITGNP